MHAVINRIRNVNKEILCPKINGINQLVISECVSEMEFNCADCQLAAVFNINVFGVRFETAEMRNQKVLSGILTCG
jgi:hypothetical protein